MDDIIISSTSKDSIDTIKQSLMNTFRMKDLGPVNYFLGIHIQHSDGEISLNQKPYLTNVLEKYGMAECKARRTPCDVGLDKKVTNDDGVEIEESNRRYKEIVGSLLYGSTCTRPDLCYVTSKLSQHLDKPDEKDWLMIKQVLRYIKGTLDYSLCYRKSKDFKTLRF